MKFHDHNLSGSDPYSEGLDRDLWRRINDDWEFYRRQDEQWLTGQFASLPEEQPMIAPIEISWIGYGDQSANSILVRMITGGATLALLGYLYWML